MADRFINYPSFGSAPLTPDPTIRALRECFPWAFAQCCHVDCAMFPELGAACAHQFPVSLAEREELERRVNAVAILVEIPRKDTP